MDKETYVVIWIISIVVTAVVASERKMNILFWLTMSVLIGPFAVLYVFLASPNVVCRDCRAAIDPQARVCPHCGRKFDSEKRE